MPSQRQAGGSPVPAASAVPPLHRRRSLPRVGDATSPMLRLPAMLYGHRSATGDEGHIHKQPGVLAASKRHRHASPTSTLELLRWRSRTDTTRRTAQPRTDRLRNVIRDTRSARRAAQTAIEPGPRQVSQHLEPRPSAPGQRARTHPSSS